MCWVTTDNNNDARSAPIPPVTQDKVTHNPEDANNDPTASDSPSVCIGNILEEDKNTQCSKMHKSALQHLNIFFREFRKPSKHPPATYFKYFCSFKDIVYKDLCHQSNIFWADGNYFAEHVLKPQTVKSSKDLLSFTYATNYFYAIKNYYLDQF